MLSDAILFDGFLNRMPFEPTECQRNALAQIAVFLESDQDDVMVVNGYAGTGKTTVLAAVIATLMQKNRLCVLLAPTGRAAKVLSSYAGVPAMTIHKHIYRQKSIGGDGFGQFSLSPNKSKDAVFIVDEASLITIDAAQQQGTAQFGTGDLLSDLIDFVRAGRNCKVILVGDSAQLPPVGLSCSPVFMRDYMAMFGGVSYVNLTTVVRQQKESGILHNATLLRKLIEDPYGCDPSRLKFQADIFDDFQRVEGGELIDILTQAYEKFGEDETIYLCRSNKGANRCNAGIRSMVQYKEERLVRGDSLMIVKNCYQFDGDVENIDYIANGDMAKLVKISRYEERYGLHFATARLSFPDYDEQEIVAKVILDTLDSESPSLTYAQQNALYQGVNEDYSHLTDKKKRYQAVREDPYFNALQLKYANAITAHKSQGGQWSCVFVENPLWQPEITIEDLKWLYTAITRGVEKVYMVGFKDNMFDFSK